MYTNRKWLVLSRNNIDNFIYKFSLFDGNKEQISKHLIRMREKDILNSKQKIAYEEYSILNTKEMVTTYLEFTDSYIDYYAIPITTKFNWVIAMYIGGINEYDFHFILTDNEETVINKMKEIWFNEYRKHKGENVPNPIIKQSKNDISIEMFLSNIGSIDIIAFSSKLLEDKQTFIFGNN